MMAIFPSRSKHRHLGYHKSRALGFYPQAYVHIDRDNRALLGRKTSIYRHSVALTLVQQPIERFCIESNLISDYVLWNSKSFISV